VFRGTPPPKPLNCKSVLNHRGALIGNLWAHPTGEEFCLLCAIFNLVLSDITKTSFFVVSQYFHLLSLSVAFSSREIKNPAYSG